METKQVKVEVTVYFSKRVEVFIDVPRDKDVVEYLVGSPTLDQIVALELLKVDLIQDDVVYQYEDVETGINGHL
jgi:hypothetical protein